VQNGGFENNSGFPSSVGQWSLATNWSNANSSSASPDYLHTSGSGIVQLPNSIFGNVNPFQGNAVMGLAMWYSNSSNFREYISQNLTTPLTVGSSYTFSFFISNGTPGNYGGTGIKNVQVDFSINPINQISSAPLGYTPLLNSGTMIYSNNWIPVTYTFIATAPYAFFAIGNFMDDANTVVQQFNATANPAAYYFIDEVSLTLNTGNNINIIGDSQICLGNSAILQASNSSVFEWANSLNPNIIIDNDSILAVAPAITTTYLVYGSNDTSSFTVNVIDCEVILEMPNVFTPNNDGVNDYFHIKELKGINQATLRIYNRWGQKLIEKNDILSGWDGKYNGEYCTDGTYFWIIQYTTMNNESKTKTGFLTLAK
jgi:gliding motility-associated-like protein